MESGEKVKLDPITRLLAVVAILIPIVVWTTLIIQIVLFFQGKFQFLDKG